MKMLIICLLILFVACGKKQSESSPKSKQNVSAIFKAKTIKVNVYYEPGAEPYTTESLLPLQYFSLLEANIQALFSGRANPPQIIVPKTLAQMILLPAQNEASWTVDEAIELNKKHQASSDPTVFNIYFVNGLAASSGGVIGFQIGGTTTMMIFKDVIRATGVGNLELVPKYVEQSTLIHEMGHALGLVNNGIPMKASHHDKENGHHCTNPDCVMYYSNEGTSSMIRFAQKAITEQNTIMFDNNCLRDARSY